MAWLTVLSLSALISKTFADYCGENIFCHAPYKCCDSKKSCCYDSISYSNSHIRSQIWNMWYFWFLVIFMMISCFGGCGYYRRRRLAMLSRVSHQMAVRPLPNPVANDRSFSRNSEENARQYNYFAYSGPDIDIPEALLNLPPPYAEVVNQPELYPINKMEVPPYPGVDKPEDSQTVMPPHEMSLPPPYSESPFEPPQPFQPSIQNVISSHLSPSHPDNVEQQPTVPPRRADDHTVNSANDSL